MHVQVDRGELKMEIRAEQVQWMFGGPQASSYENANIVVIKANSGASNHYPWVLFIILYYLWFLDVHEVIGVEFMP
jgi:hypothetical protein